MHFEHRGEADYTELTCIDHGWIETRRIWVSTALNEFLDFPHTGQVFLVDCESIDKKTGVKSLKTAIGITRRTPSECSAQRLLAINRGH